MGLLGKKLLFSSKAATGREATEEVSLPPDDLLYRCKVLT